MTFKVILAENIFTMIFNERIPRSTLSYWEMNYNHLAKEVFKVLLETLRRYNCTFQLNSLIEEAHEIFTSIRFSEALFPIHGDLGGGVHDGLPAGSHLLMELRR